MTDSDMYVGAICFYNFECDGCNHYTPKVCFNVAVRRVKWLEQILAARDQEIAAMRAKNEKLEKIVRDVFMEDQ